MRVGCGDDPAAPLGAPIEWHQPQSPLGPVTVALVRPEAAAGAGPHPVIFALPWGAGTASLVAGTVQSYWDTEAPARGYYVVSPVVRGSTLAETAADVIPALFAWMDAELDYDAERVLLTGASNGGRGVFFAAVAEPDRFRALLAMPGRYEGEPEDAAVLAGKTVRLMVGELDTSWVEASEATKAVLDAHGIETTLDVVAGQDHVLRLSQADLMDWVEGVLNR